MELTIKEVASRLNIPVDTLYRWVRQGKIPMQRSRGGHVIRQELLERWAETHRLKLQAPPNQAQAGQEAAQDGVLPAMERGGFFYNLSGAGKEAALQSAVDNIPHLERIDRKIIFEKLLEREQMASTGIGHGVALPHPRANPGIGLILPQITTCFFEKPVPFDAIDNRPVSVMMVLLCGSTQLHLTLLSKISFYLRNAAFRDYLLTAPPAEELLARIADVD